MLLKKLIVVFFFILLISCKQDKNSHITTMNSITNLNSIPKKNWNELSNKKIYFGHQSVGFNIIEGMEMHLKKNPDISLDVRIGNELEVFNKAGFVHSRIGENGNPKSKIDDFCNSMEKSLGNTVDIAGFKFCYVDFNNETDVNEIFEYYKAKMHDIQSKYPNVKFIHFTVPIRVLQRGFKGQINKILGRDIGVKNNIARQKFNTLLNNEFNNSLVYDIAKYESTSMNGERNYSLEDDEKVYSMIHYYSNDGGHLSKIGKDIIGEKLLIFLAQVK